MKTLVATDIAHQYQRYPTAGDWLADDAQITVRASRCRDNRSTIALAVHEIVEAFLCDAQGVTQAMVDEFDMGDGAMLDEPGADPRAPYREQHAVAEEVERLVVAALGLSWEDHSANVDELFLKKGD